MKGISQSIESPHDEALGDLCGLLRELGGALDTSGGWPQVQLRRCAEYGVFAWFVPKAWGGRQWSESEIVEGYLALSSACLTTTFIITQRTGACQRIERSENEWVKRRVLPGMITGDVFATVGISHLTTSRRHLDRAVLRAEATANGFVLSGYSPWVTGASAAQFVVVGATLDDSRQILVALPTDLPGVEIPAPARLVGLAASHTGPLLCHDVHVGREWLLAGPVNDVMKQGLGAKTGGLQTSTLAIGLARSALDYLEEEAARRIELRDSAQALRADWFDLRNALLQAAADQPVCTDADLRARANSLVLRASQSALAAAKGTGYVAGHPAGRWCREALFFLVWSCPQPVLAANLCEFAGLEG